MAVFGLFAAQPALALDVECRFSTGSVIDVEDGKPQVREMTKEQFNQFTVLGIQPSPIIRHEEGFRERWGDRKLRLLSRDAQGRYFSEILPMGNVRLFTWYPATGIAIYSLVVPIEKISARVAVGTCSRMAPSKAHRR